MSGATCPSCGHAHASNLRCDIAASQRAYAARPWFLMWRDSHCQVPDRFDTFDELFSEVQRKWAMIRGRVARERYNASDLHRSYVKGPDGQRVSLRYYLLCDDVSSY